jgi:hypothetical protein
MRYLIILLLIVGCASQKNKCKKIPWYKKQPNSYFKQDSKQNKNKYKSHKRSERKKHKCK